MDYETSFQRYLHNLPLSEKVKAIAQSHRGDRPLTVSRLNDRMLKCQRRLLETKVPSDARSRASASSRTVSRLKSRLRRLATAFKP